MKSDVPVLLIIWRRPETLRRVIGALRAVKPTRIFVAGDGPSPSRPREVEQVAQARSLIDSMIDWPCKIERFFSETNQGCRRAVEGAIDWFFQNVEEGIILEDDCVPHPDFFAFCGQLLEHYRLDLRVGCITGNNFQGGQRRGSESYYFSKYPHCWGWATWRRGWREYSSHLDFWPEWRRSRAWKKCFPIREERRYWSDLFNQSHKGSEDVWDYGWTATLNHKGVLTATPQVNLVQNVGFGDDSTHFPEGTTPRSIPTQPLGPIVHPMQVMINQEADEYVFRNLFFRGSAVHGGKMIREAKKIWKFIGGMAKKLRTEF